MSRATVYAVRDAETRERLSYRYHDRREAVERMRELHFTGRVMEVYRTSQDLPRQPKRGQQ